MNYYSNDNGRAYEDLIQYQQRCPCDDNMLDADHDLFFLEHVRRLANSTSSVAPTPMSSFAPTPVPVPPKPWEVIYSVIVLVLMFAALISERIGTDMVMMAVVTLYMVAGIITVQEGLSGFANDSIWAVIVLFVVAGGISKTGALDWCKCPPSTYTPTRTPTSLTWCHYHFFSHFSRRHEQIAWKSKILRLRTATSHDSHCHNISVFK